MDDLIRDRNSKLAAFQQEIDTLKETLSNNVKGKEENSGENLNAPTFNQLFEINELKAQLQEKDTVIRKLTEKIKSLSGKDSVENVKKDIDEIETINIELEHSVAKLLSENENLRKKRDHLKSIYKDQFDSIRKTRVQSKKHCDSLIAQINAKYLENSDLNAQLQEKVFANAALKSELRKLKGKNVVDTAVSKPNATIAPGMFKLNIEPISPRLKNNKDAHEVYIDKTIEYTVSRVRQNAVQNDGNEVGQNEIQNPSIQNVENMNGLSVVSEIANQYRNRNVVTTPTEGNGNGINGNPIRCYNCRGEGHHASNYTVKPRKLDAAYLQQQLQIAQEEEVGIQSTQEEFKFMAAADAYEETERVKLNYTLEDTLQQASTSGTQSDNALVYDSDRSTEVPKDENCYDHDIFNMLTHEVQYTDLQTELDRTKEKLENYIIKKEKEYDVLWNNWYTKCEECKYDKISYDKAYNDMQQKIKRLQAQLGDLKGKSSDTQCASNTLDPVSKKLKDENVSLEFQV
ncbi:hypothetical protein Tco_0026879 [Tanacetum coccineum]